MKKLIIATVVISLFSGCFISRIFQKKEKLGCESNGRNIGAERIAAGDEKAIRASNKAKFKGPKSY